MEKSCRIYQVRESQKSLRREFLFGDPEDSYRRFLAIPANDYKSKLPERCHANVNVGRLMQIRVILFNQNRIVGQLNLTRRIPEMSRIANGLKDLLHRLARDRSP